jgi:HD-GYP domain-containing protein (c-di-GMP phosphodiesterase class II)
MAQKNVSETDSLSKEENSIKIVENFLNDAREGVLAIDEDGIISYVNASFAKMSGKQPEQMIGANYQQMSGQQQQTDTLRGLEEAHMQTLKFLADAENKRKDLDNRLKDLQQNFLKFIITFVKVLEARDPYIQGHSARVARYAMILAKAAEVPKDLIQNLAYSGMFHDLGMITVPMDIIHKATILSPREVLEVRKHPILGAEYVKDIELFKNIIPDILYHHERWDGAGYPKGLRGEQIPTTARILFIAEAYDALTSKRPYRLARERDEAIRILRENRGTQFDPRLVDIFCGLLDSKVI